MGGRSAGQFELTLPGTRVSSRSTAITDQGATSPSNRAPEFHRGLCVRGGVGCYLCERPLRSGDRLVLFFDSRFWEQAVVYHAACWAEADLDAKGDSPGSVVEAPAIELPETDCATCGMPIEAGELVIGVEQRPRIVRRVAGLVVLYHHARCYEPFRAHDRGY